MVNPISLLKTLSVIPVKIFGLLYDYEGELKELTNKKQKKQIKKGFFRSYFYDKPLDIIFAPSLMRVLV